MSSSAKFAGTPPQPTPGHMPGTRGNLTPSQTRALYRLWSRFFRLCQEPAAPGSVGSTSNSVSASSSAEGKNAGGNIPYSTNGSTRPYEASSSSRSDFRGKTVGHSDSSQLGGRATSSHTRLDSGVSTLSGGGVGGSKLGRRVSAGAPPSSLNGASDSASTNGPHLGSKIPRDDGVKDELKTLEEAKEMRTFLDRYGGERLRTVFWEMVKGEHPDALMLRFLRARKWDVDRAIAVIGATAAFRIENDVEALVRGGELELCKTKGGRNIFQNGISYVYGASYTGEPVYFIEVGSHFSHAQTQSELKRAIILLQEWLSMLMPPPVEQKVVVFNLRNFGLRNMDWWTVFFMVKTMESYYVESLARVYVHCPPWIFRPIWAILRPLLDPVVRDKVRLTSTVEELSDHIPWDHLPKDSMGGGADWGFSYPLPDSQENDLQLDTETRDRLRAAYSEVAMDFERSTARIIRRYQAKAASRSVVDGFSSADVSDEDYRDVLATRLRVAWLRLAPYVVGRSKYHRWGVVNDDGIVRWNYHTLEGKHEVQTCGEGTTLGALEAGLEQIEAAQKHADTTAVVEEPSQSNGRAVENGRHRRQRTGGTGTRALDEALGLDTGDVDLQDAPTAPATTSDQTDQTSSTARPAETASEGSPVSPLKTILTDQEQQQTALETSSVDAVVPVHPLEASSDSQA
ncbi:Phosphatidylinositol transfer protein PDR16 and related proteins [Ceraceosorus bombacis]|uniref:Phosphatidylinositol transfer protein PDR16 and related proteins n=1 Tax=Ceraceosorus bombacis TaxID=401625 RepID=A0A0P1B9G4_9BASI|nr:Phosphatidylinositol transfer protein PDR16 and related proteins [Ceraceosorus bombacis]